MYSQLKVEGTTNSIHMDNMQIKVKKLSIKKARAGKKRLKDYGKVLLAKQLLRAVYNNPKEKTFKKYFLSKVDSGSINSIFEKLNSRLDVVLTAMGGASSNKHARQLISHGKITVNGHIIKERGYLLSDGDILSSSEKFQKESSNSQIKELSKGEQNFLSLKVASLKPKKIPSYLKLKTPIFANLFVNVDLNYGIYYSKPINLNEEVSSSDTSSRAYPSGITKYSRETRFPQRSSEGNVSLGWKNTNVKSVKTLLLDLKGSVKKDSFIDTKHNKVKKVYSLFYSLVQDYYSRQY